MTASAVKTILTSTVFRAAFFANKDGIFCSHHVEPFPQENLCCRLRCSAAHAFYLATLTGRGESILRRSPVAISVSSPFRPALMRIF